MRISDDDFKVWFDKDFSMINQDRIMRYQHGAQGQRLLGRMACYNFYNDITRDIHNDLNNLSNRTGFPVQNIDIYIISSLCGGTGSGIFCDISAIVCNFQGCPDKIQAVLISPDVYLMDIPHEIMTTMKFNTVAFFKEIDFFMNDPRVPRKRMAEYSCRESAYEGSSNVDFAPFSRAYIYDSVTSEDQRINPSAFFEEVAVSLFAIMNVNFQIGLPAGIQIYNTSGYLKLKYPKNEIKEYFRLRALNDVWQKKLLVKDFSQQEISVKAEQFILKLFDRLVNENINKLIREFSENGEHILRLLHEEISNVKKAELKQRIREALFELRKNLESSFGKIKKDSKGLKEHIIYLLSDSVNDIACEYGLFSARYFFYPYQDLIKFRMEKLKIKRHEIDERIERIVSTINEKLDSPSKIFRSLIRDFDEIFALLNKLQTLFNDGLKADFEILISNVVLNDLSELTKKYDETLLDSGILNTNKYDEQEKGFIKYINNEKHNPIQICIPDLSGFLDKNNGEIINDCELDGYYINNIEPLLNLNAFLRPVLENYPEFFVNPQKNKIHLLEEVVEKFIFEIMEQQAGNNIFNKTINAAFNDLDVQQQNCIRNEITHISYFLQLKLPPIQLSTSVHTVQNPSFNLTGFINTNIAPQGITIIDNPAIHDESEIIISTHYTGFNPKNIRAIEASRYYYEHRDIKSFRPHIVGTWNGLIDFVDQNN